MSSPREPSLPAVSLVLGGARSGKSAYAERLCPAGGVYVATAAPADHEMADRIRHHRARRGPAWTTIEEPLDLAGVLSMAAPGRPLLIDCLTLWLSNLLEAGRDVAAETTTLTQALRAAATPVVLVSNEVGMGIVPSTPLGRAFRDHAGQLNQAVAAVADRVVLVIAGLPLVLKDVAP